MEIKKIPVNEITDMLDTKFTAFIEDVAKKITAGTLVAGCGRMHFMFFFLQVSSLRQFIAIVKNLMKGFPAPLTKKHSVAMLSLTSTRIYSFGY